MDGASKMNAGRTRCPMLQEVQDCRKSLPGRAGKCRTVSKPYKPRRVPQCVKTGERNAGNEAESLDEVVFFNNGFYTDNLFRSFFFYGFNPQPQGKVLTLGIAHLITKFLLVPCFENIQIKRNGSRQVEDIVSISLDISFQL